MPMKSLLFITALLLTVFGQSFAQRTPLKSGEKAPSIKFQDVQGNSYKLADMLKDNKKVLLCFMRPVWCPVCNARTNELKENYKALKEKGYEVVVIYPSPLETMKSYVTDYDLPFIVVADPSEELYGQYQVEKSQRKITAYLKHKEAKQKMKKGNQLYKEKGKKYAKKGDEHGPLVPADFVVDPAMNLLNVYYGEFMGDHLPLDTL